MSLIAYKDGDYNNTLLRVRTFKDIRDDPSFNAMRITRHNFNDTLVPKWLHFLGRDSRRWESVSICTCAGHVDVILQKLIVRVRRLVMQACLNSVASISTLSTGLKFNKSLLALKITRTQWTGGRAAIFGAALKHCHLQDMYLQNCNFEPDAMPLFADGLAANKSLRVLHIKACGITDAGFAVLVSALSSHVRAFSFDLSHSIYGPLTVAALANMLQEKDCKLNGLALTSFAPPSVTVARIDLPVLLDALYRNTSLMELCLCGNLVTDEQLSLLAGVFAPGGNSTLRSLNLANNALTGRPHLSALSDVLCQSDNTFSLLNLSHNLLSSASIQQFATRLAQMGGLKKLDVHHNPFGAEGSKCLLDALEANCVLECLDIPPCENADRLIEHYTSLNRGGRRLLRHQDRHRLAIWPMVLERAGTTLKYFGKNDKWKHPNNTSLRINALYNLLQSAPVLFDQPRRENILSENSVPKANTANPTSSWSMSDRNLFNISFLEQQPSAECATVLAECNLIRAGLTQRAESAGTNTKASTNASTDTNTSRKRTCQEKEESNLSSPQLRPEQGDLPPVASASATSIPIPGMGNDEVANDDSVGSPKAKRVKVCEAPEYSNA
jgi:hypothetical protein